MEKIEKQISIGKVTDDLRKAFQTQITKLEKYNDSLTELDVVSILKILINDKFYQLFDNSTEQSLLNLVQSHLFSLKKRQIYSFDVLNLVVNYLHMKCKTHGKYQREILLVIFFKTLLLLDQDNYKNKSLQILQAAQKYFNILEQDSKNYIQILIAMLREIDQGDSNLVQFQLLFLIQQVNINIYEQPKLFIGSLKTFQEIILNIIAKLPVEDESLKVFINLYAATTLVIPDQKSSTYSNNVQQIIYGLIDIFYFNSLLISTEYNNSKVKDEVQNNFLNQDLAQNVLICIQHNTTGEDMKNDPRAKNTKVSQLLILVKYTIKVSFSKNDFDTHEFLQLIHSTNKKVLLLLQQIFGCLINDTFIEIKIQRLYKNIIFILTQNMNILQYVLNQQIPQKGSQQQYQIQAENHLINTSFTNLLMERRIYFTPKIFATFMKIYLIDGFKLMSLVTKNPFLTQSLLQLEPVYSVFDKTLELDNLVHEDFILKEFTDCFTDIASNLKLSRIQQRLNSLIFEKLSEKTIKLIQIYQIIQKQKRLQIEQPTENKKQQQKQKSISLGLSNQLQDDIVNFKSIQRNVQELFALIVNQFTTFSDGLFQNQLYVQINDFLTRILIIPYDIILGALKNINIYNLMKLLKFASINFPLIGECTILPQYIQNFCEYIINSEQVQLIEYKQSCLKVLHYLNLSKQSFKYQSIENSFETIQQLQKVLLVGQETLKQCQVHQEVNEEIEQEQIKSMQISALEKTSFYSIEREQPANLLEPQPIKKVKSIVNDPGQLKSSSQNYCRRQSSEDMFYSALSYIPKQDWSIKKQSPEISQENNNIELQLVKEQKNNSDFDEDIPEAVL